MRDILDILAKEFDLDEGQIEKTINLIDEGNTIPFIARYRKEKTGGLKDTEIRDIESGLTRLRNFEKRKEEILTSLENQEKLDDELKEKIENAKTLTELEDIYAPFKKKRKTRADKAKELGLMELLDEILMNATSEEEGLELAKKYIKEGVEDEVDAINKSLDILAEDVANIIEFFASDNSKALTGQILVSDFGASL